MLALPSNAGHRSFVPNFCLSSECYVVTSHHIMSRRLTLSVLQTIWNTKIKQFYLLHASPHYQWLECLHLISYSKSELCSGMSGKLLPKEHSLSSFLCENIGLTELLKLVNNYEQQIVALSAINFNFFCIGCNFAWKCTWNTSVSMACSTTYTFGFEFDSLE